MRTGYAEDIVRTFRRGQRVYFQGGPGECEAFYNVLRDNPGLTNGVELWSCLIPGINQRDYGSLPGNATLTTFMASPTLEPSIATGRTVVRAMPYSEIGALMAETVFDVAVLHVAPPDAQGNCSFGIASDMGGLVWPQAERRFAFGNSRMPSIPGADFIPAEQIEFAVMIDAPLPTAPPALDRTRGKLAEIAHVAAGLIPDGATIQSGIGEAPAAIVAALKLHRDLRVHSGIVTQEYQHLAEAGALNAGAEHVAGVAWGDAAFYKWLERSGFAFRSANITHGHEALASIEGFASIGSALEVDLAGNLNLEWRSGRRISSVGGAPDYLRAAAVAPGGLSIIALPATTGSGASRIVPKLGSPSITGEFVDAVVTEFGVARLKGLSVGERAQALCAIAAPQHREFLERG